MRHPFHLAGLVAGDHAALDTLLARIEAGQGDLVALCAEVSHLLAVHGAAEEHVLDPQLRDAGLGDVAAQHRRDHLRLERAMDELAHHGAGSDAAQAAMRAIADVAGPHDGAGPHDVDRDEREHLVTLSDQFGDERMVALGRSFLDAQRRAASRVHRRSSGAAGDAGDPGVTVPSAMLHRLRGAISGRHEALATDASWLLDLQAQRVVDAFASLSARQGRMIHLLEPAAARRLPTLVDAVASLTRDDRRSERPGGAEPADDVVIAGPAGPVRLRIHRPDSPSVTATGALQVISAAAAVTGVTATDRLPVYLHVHGGGGLGGGVVGGLDLADGPCRSIARQAGCLAIAVEYRLAPEHPFPAGHDDVLAALRWAMSDAAVFGADTRRVAIGGEGIGATMAAAAAVQVRATGRGPVALVLVTPMTAPWAAIEPSSFPSWSEAADARPMSSAVARWCLGHLVSGVSDLDDPRLSLLSMPETTLARFPPTLVLTAERDPWRDEGAAFAAALRAAGVDVEHTRYDGVMHGFFVASEVIDRAAIAQTQVAAAVCRAVDPGHLMGVIPSSVPHRGRTGGLHR